MEKYIDVIKQTLELSQTCLEGLEYVVDNLSEGYKEQAITMFKDVVEAFYHMQESIHIFIDRLKDNDIEDMTDIVQQELERIVFCLEKDDLAQGFDLLDQALLPKYQAWKMEVERNLYPFILS